MKTTINVLVLFVIGLLLLSGGCKKDKKEKPLPSATFPVYDIDGNGYDTVHIGTQVWFKQNLRTTRLNDGVSIPDVTDPNAWKVLSSGARCWYNNDSATYAKTYGALYNWYVVGTGKLCPTGWHVPSDPEWQTMEMHLGMTQAQVGLTDWRGTDEGGKLKEAGTAHWITPNVGATNSSGFTALPGGGRGSDDGYFAFMGYYGFWWSPSSFGSSDAWYRNLDHNGSQVGRSCVNKGYGFSVRCVKN
jgi:uncharacterized protein (TIGR02145 family)